MPFPMESVRLLRPVRRGTPPSRGRLRLAATALFALDGAVFGSWASRIPDVTAQVGATPTTLGLALLCVSLGALASMQLTGALCTRLGSGLVAAVSAGLLCCTVALPGLASTVAELCAALLVFGAVTGTVNVAANSVGVQVQAMSDRSVVPSLHAGFSFGGLTGAALGGLTAGLAPSSFLLLIAGVGLAVTAAIAPTLAAADAPRHRESAVPPARGPRSLLVLLGLIAGCTAYGEGAVTDWGALHLREVLHASPAVAAAGYAAFSLAMACGRLGGGGLVRALGETRLLVGGSLLAALGMVAAATSDSAATALVGFALVGLGLANVFPLAIARAGATGGAGGVALASTVGYTGLLGGPPVIGFLADQVGLPAALSSVALLAVVAAGLSVVVGVEDLRPQLAVAGSRLAAHLRPADATVPTAPFEQRYADVLSILNGRRSAIPVPA